MNPILLSALYFNANAYYAQQDFECGGLIYKNVLGFILYKGVLDVQFII